MLQKDMQRLSSLANLLLTCLAHDESKQIVSDTQKRCQAHNQWESAC